MRNSERQLDQQSGASGTFIRSVPRFCIVAVTLLCCVGCDQATKSAARALLSSGSTKTFFADVLRLQLAENPGSFLSLGASLSESVRFALFVGSVGVILLSLLCVIAFSRRLSGRRVVAIALVAGGGIGNLIDRLIFSGQVTDFLNVGVGSLRTGIFNVADMAILSGALLLILNWKNTTPERTAP